MAKEQYRSTTVVQGASPFEKTTNLIKVISKPEMCIFAYKYLKRNKVAMLKTADVDKAIFNFY